MRHQPRETFNAGINILSSTFHRTLGRRETHNTAHPQKQLCLVILSDDGNIRPSNLELSLTVRSHLNIKT